MPRRIIDRPAKELVAAMRSGDLPATVVMAAFLREVAESESVVRAWTWIDSSRAMDAAAGADSARESGKPTGSLHGLPVGVKDIIDTADMPTECGTAAYRGRQPTTDATIVARLRSAGAIVVGKTVTAEFAYRHPGPTRNPLDHNRTPGGSSSGSAAAVAAGMVPVAIGTQTNGSVIRPASFCGVVGYKPGLGVLPRTGILRQSVLLDQPGVMARNVEDCAFVTGAISGPDVADELSLAAAIVRSHEPLTARSVPRLAFVRGPFWHRGEASTHAALESLAAIHRMPIVDLPDEFSEAEGALDCIMSSGIAEAVGKDFPGAAKLFSNDLMEVVERGRRASAVAYLQACLVRDRLRQAFERLVSPYDAILTAAAPGAAPAYADGTGNPIFSTIWSLIGAPAISVPLLRADDGMPIGVQMVGALRDDAGLLQAAQWLEQAQPTAAAGHTSADAHATRGP